MQTRHGRYKRIPAAAANGQSEPGGSRTGCRKAARPGHALRALTSQIRQSSHVFAERDDTLTAWAIRVMMGLPRRTAGRSDRRDAARRGRSRPAKSGPGARSDEGTPGRPAARLKTTGRPDTRGRTDTRSRAGADSQPEAHSQTGAHSPPEERSRAGADSPPGAGTGRRPPTAADPRRPGRARVRLLGSAQEWASMRRGTPPQRRAGRPIRPGPRPWLHPWLHR
jgi:hypothetical protein